MPPKTLRKQASRFQKRLKKQRTEQSDKRQYETTHKYVPIKPRDASDNQDLIDDNVDGDNMNVDGISDDNFDDDGVNDTNVDDTGDVHGGNISVDSGDIDDTNLENTRGGDDTNEINAHNLNVDNPNANVHYGYANGSNMKGKHRGVQKKLLDINPRAFNTLCGCHNLNLTLCDIDSYCGKAMDIFEVIQHIYTIFVNSSKRWLILKNNVKGLALKSLSITRWESRVESVKAIRFQLLKIREALFQVAENDNDSKIKSESKSLAINELGDFELLVSTVIWFDILSVVNFVSKKLQSYDMLIDIIMKEVEGLISFFVKFRDMGFDKEINVAKEIAIEMDIDLIFRQSTVLLSIPITMVSAERSFSKLKLLKFYLRSTISQERLNGLALIAIKNGLLESVNYEALINNFASKNARRSAFFKKLSCTELFFRVIHQFAGAFVIKQCCKNQIFQSKKVAKGF
ncbi:zinc finger MYM-type protein 1 [Artemisia annua]|uniref:Zinc finger MYM-type protein 1 n=1 Tax=Artemisia annua TaxID=35608 RepID=A0A2U1P052_ARTAN|nr:zinc finger MYM-type protein 1 [Artemisia annua]